MLAVCSLNHKHCTARQCAWYRFLTNVLPAEDLEINLDSEASHAPSIETLTCALKTAVVGHTVAACSLGKCLRAYLKDVIGSSSDGKDR